VNAQVAPKMLTPEAELSVMESRQHGTLAIWLMRRDTLAG